MDTAGRAASPQRRPQFGRLYRRIPRSDPRAQQPAPAPPSEPPQLDLYDVLMDREHPAFADLGRLLWTLIATQPSWIDRRVETASLTAERRFRRHMSVDCRMPPSVLELATDLGLSRFLVPLRFVTKSGPMLAFDLRLDDQSVPWLTRSQNAMAARSVLYAAVDHLGPPLTPDLDAAIGDVAGADVAASDRVLELLGLNLPGDNGDFESLPAEGLAVPEELVRWLVTTLDHNFLLLADVGIPQVRRRTVFKITQELGLRVQEPLPILAQMAWEPTSFVFDCPDVTATSSYHFQFVAPDGMIVAGGELFGAPRDGDDDNGDAGHVVGSLGEPDGEGDGDSGGESGIGGRTESFGISASQGSVLGLNTHVWDVPEAETYNVEVLVRPSPDGLLRASAVSAGFSTILLFLAAAFAHRLDGGRLDASIALLLVLPGLVSTFLARPGEHHLVSRLLRGVRLLTLASAIIVYFAAAVVVAGVAGSALRWTWTGMALLSAIPTVVLVVAVERSRLRLWSS